MRVARSFNRARGGSALTTYLGEFRFDRLAAGTYVVVFRHVGFVARTDTITVKDGQAIDGEYPMASAPVSLEAAKTVASNAIPWSPALVELNERRKLGLGHFITEDELRKQADGGRNLVDFVKAKLPGMKVIYGPGGEQYLASGRKACANPAFQCGNGMSFDPCYLNIYVDGVTDFVSKLKGQEPTDFTDLRSEDFAAIEYYAGGATAPVKYNQTGSDCGVLLLWRRYHAGPGSPR